MGREGNGIPYAWVNVDAPGNIGGLRITGPASYSLEELVGIGRLVAAAPDLLDAAGFALLALERLRPSCPHEPVGSTVETLEDAIEKAGGWTPPYPIGDATAAPAGSPSAFRMLAGMLSEERHRARLADERHREATARAERAEDRAAELAEAATGALQMLRESAKQHRTAGDNGHGKGCEIHGDALTDALRQFEGDAK